MKQRMTGQLPKLEEFTDCVNLAPSHEAHSILVPYKALHPLIVPQRLHTTS